MELKKLIPSLSDPRDHRFNFERVFGSSVTFDESYFYDLGMRMEDQEADNRPSECTGYTVCDIAADERGFLFSPDYNFMHTLMLMGVPPSSWGADLRTSFIVPVKIGLIPLDDELPALMRNTQEYAANPDNWPAGTYKNAAQFKFGAYIPIYPITGDWFDAIRNALVNGKAERRNVGVGTPWSPDFERVGSDGVLTDDPTGLYFGHAYKFCGWKTINNQPYMIAKTWQGSSYGDKGYVYMSRRLVNKLMGTPGAFAATLQNIPSPVVAALKGTRVPIMARVSSFVQNLRIRALWL